MVFSLSLSSSRPFRLACARLPVPPSSRRILNLYCPESEVFNPLLTKIIVRPIVCSFFVSGGLDTMAKFDLQPAEAELQQLAEQLWNKACDREHQLEIAAFEAGKAIRNGDYTLENLEAIVRWKSERVVHYLIG